MDTNTFIVYIKQKTFKQTLQKMLKQDLNQTDCYQKKRKKVIFLMKDELGGRIMKEFSPLRAKTHSYLTYNNNGD